MKKPQTLAMNNELLLAVADFYEYSMARANLKEGIAGKQTVFDLVVRNMPEGRSFLVNAGLEQAVAYLLEAHGNEELRDYFKQTMGIEDQPFLDWINNIKFEGDLYAMPEGTIFFGQEPQLRVHERFEEAQVFESLFLNTINPQTNVATTANDIASVTNKILLEGGSRRGTSPQSALFNSRAARVGGFTASSNVGFGIKYNEKVGGTHGHSYVMFHPTEYAAFKAQGNIFGDNGCFLLDTYDVKKAFEIALNIVEEEKLKHFAFRIDSGNLLEQARWIHRELAEREFARGQYTVVASDDLTVEKIADLERNGADIDKYLVGTYVVNPAKPLGGVYKLAAFREEDGSWELRGKFSENPAKATLPGIKQIYRVINEDGYYQRDIIALEGEDIGQYLKDGERTEELLVPIIKNGKQVYDFPTIETISQRRKEQLAHFQDVSAYEVLISSGIEIAQSQFREKVRGGQ